MNEEKHVRGPRWPEEEFPDPRYISIVRNKGPRKGETRLAFIKRMAVLEAVWQAWKEAWKLNKGNLKRTCFYLGIAYSSSPQELRRYGLSAAILDKLVFPDKENKK
jgi:hypothetical protein